MDVNSEAMRCNICNTPMPRRASGLCMSCVNLRDMLIPLMRNERARAYLMSQFLDQDTADAIIDMHSLTGGPRTNVRRKAWKKFVKLAKKVAGR